MFLPVCGRIRPPGNLGLVETPISQGSGQGDLGKVAQNHAQGSGDEQMVTTRHLRHHKHGGHGNTGRSPEHGRHSDDDKHSGGWWKSSARAPPSMAPTNRLGAKTPPLPPEDTVRDKATIFPMTKRSSNLSGSVPLIASWIHPYPLPRIWGIQRAISPKLRPPITGLK